ncbi:nicotinamide mononucleotide transporter [Streptomyces verrucosisporus]|nr:nicotinamide mononucleotide transporter [Streptomyces verrucosisporus]
MAEGRGVLPAALPLRYPSRGEPGRRRRPPHVLLRRPRSGGPAHAAGVPTAPPAARPPRPSDHHGLRALPLRRHRGPRRPRLHRSARLGRAGRPPPGVRPPLRPRLPQRGGRGREDARPDAGDPAGGPRRGGGRHGGRGGRLRPRPGRRPRPAPRPCGRTAGAGLYADAGLQVVYIALALYGWWSWAVGVRTWWVLACATAGATAGLTVLLDRATDSTVPFWDALTTALSLAATYGQCRKKVESWYLWIATDVVYVPLYAHKGLYLTSLLYLGFMALCVAGLLGWRRELAGRTGPAVPVEAAA